MRKSLVGLLGLVGGLGVAGVLNYFDYDLWDVGSFIPWEYSKYDLENNELLTIHQERFSFDDYCFRSVRYHTNNLDLMAISYNCDCNFDRIVVGDNSFERDSLPLYVDSAKDFFNGKNSELKELLTERGLCEE